MATETERYRDLFEHAPVMYVITGDRDGQPTILDCNALFLRTLGYARAEVLGRPLADFYTPESRRQLLEGGGYQRAIRGEFVAEERQLVTCDGRVIEALLQALPRVDPDGRVSGTHAMYVDVTERKRATEALAERTRQLEALRLVTEEITRELDLTTLLGLINQRATALLEATSGTVFLWDEGSQLLVPEAWHGFGAWRGEMRLRLGEGVAGTVAQRREGMVVNDYRRSLFAHLPTLERTLITAVVGEPLIYRGELLGVITVSNGGTGRSFTERDRELLAFFASQAAIAIKNARLHKSTRRRAQQLATLNELTQSLTKALNPQVVAQAILGAVQVLIPGAAGRLWRREEKDDTLCLVASVGLQEPEGGARRRFLAGEGLTGIAAATRQPVISRDLAQDTRFVNKEWAAAEGLRSGVIVPLISGDRVNGVLAIFTRVPHDFPGEELSLLQSFAAQAAIALENARLYQEIREEAAELEVRVKERTAQLEEALRAKSEFLANMSHELRTPLNAILGFAQVLQEPSLGPLTEKQTRFLGNIQKAGRHLLALVNDLLDLSAAEARRLRLHLEPVTLRGLLESVLEDLRPQAEARSLRLDSDLEGALTTFTADPVRIKQVFYNLLSNAIKFTPEGGQVIMTSRPPAAGWAEIVVQDSGIGFRREDLPKLFQPLTQLEPATTKRYEGTGLGLALVRKLVELHGGQVWADSDGPGRGARFTVRLPLLGPPRPKRILVVEDEATVLEALSLALASAGFAVERARTGTQALTALAANPPDLLILDIGLPDMDGWEVLRQVRETERTRALPLLILTGMDHVHAEQALTRGADEFLAKPVSARVLVETVGGLLAQAPTARTKPD